MAKFRYENEVVRPYFALWKKNAFEGVRTQSYAVFIEAKKQAAQFQRRKSSFSVDMDNLIEIRRQKEIIEMKIDCLLNGKDSLSKMFSKPPRIDALHKVKRVVTAAATFSDEAKGSKSVKGREKQDKYCSDSSNTRDDDTMKNTWLRSLSDSGFESKELEEARVEARRVTTAVARPAMRIRETRRRELRQLAETKRMSAEPGHR